MKRKTKFALGALSAIGGIAAGLAINKKIV